ncbi:MAG TPA: TrpB-like pyridoxal phosphate-dependent enzyme [Solirubrobacteraceae bacterium]|nr:TrpB-like pyridoxal phosphate-dependent enzyme [Solirubrobacteraceae bacterium]
MPASYLDRVDLSADRIPERWYNVLPDLPRMPEEYVDAATGQPLSDGQASRLFVPALVAQERSVERWIEIPGPVREAYGMWRPTPLFRAVGLERYLGTPAEIYFKYEGSGPAGSHKLNSALAQAYYAKRDGVKRLVTDTGAGQWGQAIALSCARFELELLVYMIRASYGQKPYRRILMETYGAQVRPSPGPDTAFGRGLLHEFPEHPGSEGTAVSEAMETVLDDPCSRMAVGAFSNYCLMHQTVIGLETREQLEAIDREPDFLIASVGCGSNMGGFVNPWIAQKLAGREITLIAAEPAACPTLTKGVYTWDYPDSSASGPQVLSYSLGHDFIPPVIHAGGLRYHACAPLIGLLRHEGLIDAVALAQSEIFAAGRLMARVHGYLPCPEAAHALKAAIDVALRCKEEDRKAVIVFCYSGQGFLDLGAYGDFNSGVLEDVEPDLSAMPAAVPA